MSIIKNEIPILEFDTEQTAVISPVHENLNLVLPKKCVFAFLGEYIDEYAEKTGAQIVSYFISMTKEYPVYITTYKGEKIVLCQAPVGAAAATQILDWLIGYGVREIISAGSCGALEKFAEGTFLIPEKALLSSIWMPACPWRSWKPPALMAQGSSTPSTISCFPL